MSLPCHYTANSERVIVIVLKMRNDASYFCKEENDSGKYM